MFTNDYIMRQIELLSNSIRYVFGLEDQKEEIYSQIAVEASDTSTLKSVLYKMVGENRFCEAEDYLFDYLSQHPNEDILMTAISFYAMLNKKSDEELQNNNFPRDEIMDGLRAVEKIVKENSKRI